MVERNTNSAVQVHNVHLTTLLRDAPKAANK